MVVQVPPNVQGSSSKGSSRSINLSAVITDTFANDQAEEVNAMIKASRADVILVGMGNPKQEIWLAANLEATGARLGFAVGALFVFVTGEARRAPAWMRSLRIEWVHRLAQEPWRLSRRYFLGIPLFFVRILGQRFSSSPSKRI